MHCEYFTNPPTSNDISRHTKTPGHKQQASAFKARLVNFGR